ncbi:aminopeptidase P family protein [Candidatus Bathyarchaeota archaeon]|nr:MAG: aminopeptidase P family protein [Candidatus Bathyarchaeota archaeon]TMI53489.1 MAG: aminopeptidase P family protein [Candidatus Bathyarchaeota archaeon]
MKLDKSPIRMEFLRKKLKWIQQAMREEEVDIWITFTREGNEDPLAQDLRFGDLTWRSAAIIDHDGTKTAVVGSLEVETIKQNKFYDDVVGYASEGAAPKLKQIIAKRKPKTIAINTSYDEGAADGLTSGMEMYLKRALKGYSKRFVSGEDLAIALRARLVPEEVELVKKAIVECEKIYDEVEDAIKPGKKDKYVHQFAHKLVAEKGLSTAWAYDRCPSVNVAGNPMGHIGYHNTTIRNGDFVKLDFGVNYEGYCSDIQRVYFVGPGNIPNSVKRMFETARAANDAALVTLKPGTIGYKVDGAGRKVIVKRGYPEYKHALGHVLGRSTHEIGPLLGPRWPNRYGKKVEKPVQKDMVFTIEPSVTSKLGTCNLEQDVLVTANGYEQLSKPQEEIIRVG